MILDIISEVKDKYVFLFSLLYDVGVVVGVVIVMDRIFNLFWKDNVNIFYWMKKMCLDEILGILVIIGICIYIMFSLMGVF